MHRKLATIGILSTAFVLVGCEYHLPDQPAGQTGVTPIASGELLNARLWKKPVGGETGDNEGATPPTGSRVEVYENFIIVTEKPRSPRSFSR